MPNGMKLLMLNNSDHTGTFFCQYHGHLHQIDTSRNIKGFKIFPKSSCRAKPKFYDIKGVGQGHSHMGAKW